MTCIKFIRAKLIIRLKNIKKIIYRSSIIFFLVDIRRWDLNFMELRRINFRSTNPKDN